jgi:hypothetical protein
VVTELKTIKSRHRRRVAGVNNHLTFSQRRRTTHSYGTRHRSVCWKFTDVSKESAISNIYRLTTMSCYPDNMKASSNFVFSCSLIDTRNYTTEQRTVVSA